jgi:hypothetical protein
VVRPLSNSFLPEEKRRQEIIGATRDGRIPANRRQIRPADFSTPATGSLLSMEKTKNERTYAPPPATIPTENQTLPTIFPRTRTGNSNRPNRELQNQYQGKTGT